MYFGNVPFSNKHKQSYFFPNYFQIFSFTQTFLFLTWALPKTIHHCTNIIYITIAQLCTPFRSSSSILHLDPNQIERSRPACGGFPNLITFVWGDTPVSPVDGTARRPRLCRLPGNYEMSPHCLGTSELCLPPYFTSPFCFPFPSLFSLSSYNKFNLTETSNAYDFEPTLSCSLYSSSFIRDNRQFPSRLAEVEPVHSLSGERDR